MLQRQLVLPCAEVGAWLLELYSICLFYIVKCMKGEKKARKELQLLISLQHRRRESCLMLVPSILLMYFVNCQLTCLTWGTGINVCSFFWVLMNSHSFFMLGLPVDIWYKLQIDHEKVVVPIVDLLSLGSYVWKPIFGGLNHVLSHWIVNTGDPRGIQPVGPQQVKHVTAYPCRLFAVLFL